MKIAVLLVLRRVAVPLMAFAAIVTLAGTANADAVFPIGPHQFFVGIVNGKTVNATIATNCVGPVGQPVNAHVWVNPFVPPAGGAVLGYTGSTANSITASLEFSTSAGITNEEIGTVFVYGQMLQIPATFTVPCFGTGTVAFLPGPDQNQDTRAATVDVRFVPIVSTS